MWNVETQEWGGKGHKQKGGSGQISQKATSAITTSVGQTTIAQWQRLPSDLLREVCKKEKRPPPKLKCLTSMQGPYYKYRCIIQDAKESKRGGEHDIILIPSNNKIENEEQAKEEAALLGLLTLTPKIPHERKLPEPYRTTWINAVEASKNNNNGAGKIKKSSSVASMEDEKRGGNKKNAASSNSSKLPPSSSFTTASAATASSMLVNSTSYATKAEKRQQQLSKKLEKLAKIRKYEAVRMANRNHPVFLSASTRKRIETLLRADVDESVLKALMEEEEEEEKKAQEDDDEEEDEVKMYLMERLHSEGFTRKQINTAYSHLKSESMDMERAYENCLQWLCVHLNEDLLPEGFDPRGRTLEVVKDANSGKKKQKKKEEESKQNSADDEKQVVPKEVTQLMKRYGVTCEEATLLHRAAANEKKYDDCIQTMLYNALCQASNETENIKQQQTEEENKEIASEEMEALEAIFPPEDCDIQNNDNDETCISIKLSPNQDDVEDDSEKMTLIIRIQNGLYPSTPPTLILLQSNSDWSNLKFASSTTKKQKEEGGLGTALNMNLQSYLRTSISCGEPMIYELYNHVQSLLLSLEEEDGGDESLVPKLGLESILLPYLKGGEEFLKEEKEKKKSEAPTNSNNQKQQQANGTKKKRKQKNIPSSTSTSSSETKRQRRPRERSSFWNTLPKNTPPAIAFPLTVSKQISLQRSKLPASKAKSNFLSLANDPDRRVVLVTGETGCGKTTQIPQFILEESPTDTKIVVAQPRRLAATGVAGRVAEERGDAKPGTGSVGYVVRGDTAMCNNTRLLFCTTGVLLRQLQCENALDCITHIIVDEVHERHLDTDVLLGVLKESLDIYPHLRVILMSATMDADRFAAYWGNDTPRMHIPGFTHPVTDYTLEDVLELTGYVPPKNGKKKKKYGGGGGGYGKKKQSPWADSERSDDEKEEEDEGQSTDTTSASSRITNPQSSSSFSTVPIEELVKRVDESNIDYDLLGTLVRNILNKKSRDDDGSILVFLPGAPEISKAEQTLRRILGGISGMVDLLPLHGGLQPKDQQLIFRKSPRGRTKVILSTNVAETSITIPDCTVVVDTCREKQSSYDPSNRMPLLVERFASRDSLRQRRGRAGRVRPGTCYKLISKETHNRLPQHGEPEIRRCALDQTLLSLMFLGVESGGGDFLGKLLDPPSKESIDAAIYSLEKLGAVKRDGGGNNLSLTPLGMHLAGIPAPPTVGKILIMGSLLGCRSAALAMAAGMSVGRSPFLKIDTFQFDRRGPKRGDDEEESADELRQKKILRERNALFKTVGNSDHAMLAAVYMAWSSLNGGGGERKRYCESMGLSFNGMRDMKQLVSQLDSSLCSSGYFSSKQSDANSNSWRVIRACAVSALAPGQIVRVERPGAKYSETAEGAVEKDGKAKELKFFIRGDENASSNQKDDNNTSNTTRRYHGVAEERVFMHPSSANFNVGTYPCPWLVYHQLVRTSKSFLRDATECSSYSLLLFGGKVEVQASNELLIIDDWVRLSANARIGALIGGLRGKVDDLLSKKVADPNLDIAGTVQMKIIVNLLKTDGLGE